MMDFLSSPDVDFLSESEKMFIALRFIKAERAITQEKADAVLANRDQDDFVQKAQRVLDEWQRESLWILSSQTCKVLDEKLKTMDVAKLNPDQFGKFETATEMSHHHTKGRGTRKTYFRSAKEFFDSLKK